MIQMMANDNMLQYKLNPIVIHETVRAVRSFLNDELDKYETWEELPEVLLILTGPDLSERDKKDAFRNTKGGSRSNNPEQLPS